MNQNSNCDGAHCAHSRGEVRVLPIGNGPYHGNLILCKSCHAHELDFRRERNAEVAAPFDLPAWESLEIYSTGPESTAPKKAHINWLESQCNRYANGYCSTLACLLRGGYKRGSGRVDFAKATCEAHECLMEIEALKRKLNEEK